MLSPIQLAPGMDQATMMSVLNQNFRQIESENRTKVIRDEDGVNRVLIGRSQDGKYSLRVSKEGDDVLTTPEADLIFNSSNNLFKIVESGEVDFSTPTVLNGAASPMFSASVEHDQSFSPLVIAFLTVPSPQQPGMYTSRLFGVGGSSARSVSTSGVTVGSVVEESVSASSPIGTSKGTVQFSYRYYNGTGTTMPSVTGKIKYYLLTETAA